MNSTRYLFRRIFRSPGFSAMVIVTIALAVGVNAGIFSITHAILFKSLGVPEANRIVYYTLGSGPDTFPAFSGPAYEALRANAATKDVLAWQQNSFKLQDYDGSVNADGAYVTGNAFSVLGLKPSLGRFFDETDDTPGGGRDGWNAVLGYVYWKTRFGANPKVIGQSILVDGAPVHIVGVLPREFIGVIPLHRIDIILPHRFQAVSNPGEDRFSEPNISEWFVLGRLPRGASIQSIQANLKAIEPSYRRMADPENTMFSSNLFSNTPSGSLLKVWDGRMGEVSLKSILPPVLAIEGLAGIILLFCCCNLILLFLGRASREAHTAAIRMALGARLGSEMRLSTLEFTLLAAIGCVIGIPMAWGIVRAFSWVVLSTTQLDIFSSVSPSASLLLIFAGVTLAIACLTGAGASLWNGRKRTSLSLKEGHSVTATCSRGWIIGFEAFTSILLITAVTVSGFGIQKLNNQPSGFGTSDVVLASLDFRANASGVADSTRKEAANEKIERILEGIERSPGVESVATTNIPPLSGATVSGSVIAYGAGGGIRQQQVWPEAVSLRYFSAAGTRIVQGRDFTNNDFVGAPVCILSRSAASKLFSGENPLGQSLYQNSLYCRVVGVAEDAHLKSMSEPPEAAVYLLNKEAMPTLVVHAATSGLAIQAVRNAVQAVDPTALASTIDTIETRIDADLRVQRAITLSGMICAGIAAMILGVGFFGILSLQVAERKREIGIQVALGANRLQVCVSVMKKLRRALLVGLVLGSGTGLLAATALAQVYGLSAGFVVGGYLCGLILLGILLVAAAAVPLRRALAISPMECLASE
jgi:predicted permease